MRKTTKLLVTACALTLFSVSLKAQYLRTSYFMKGSPERLQLNPAMRPSGGYVMIPAIGSLNASVSSNSLRVKDVFDIIDSGEDFYRNDKSFNRLKNHNRFNADVNTDIISFGFYKGKGFWNFNIGARVGIDGSIPKEMVRYARELDELSLIDWIGNEYLIENQSLNANAYVEVGAGYSRPIGDKLVVGGKLKMLLGAGNVNMEINRLRLKEGGTYSTIESRGVLNVSMKGMALETYRDEETGMDYVDDVDFDKFGIAGYGFGVDLGATYQLNDRLTLSAAVTDLGFIAWDKNSTTTAKADREVTYDYGDVYNSLFDGDLIDFKLPGFEIEGKKSRTTTLASTMVLGAEYSFLDDKLSAGVLSTTRFCEPKTLTEVTLSANYRPKKWINASLSYSVIQSDMQTFGLGLKLGPVFLGTDYMYLGDSSGSKAVNAYLGICVPLGGGKKKKSE